MLATFNMAASHSVGVTSNATLPPYPALGLMWMMHTANHPFPTLSEIQALHQLASLAASPSTAKILADSSRQRSAPVKASTGSSPILLTPPPVEAPLGPGIAPRHNVIIKPPYCSLKLLLRTILRSPRLSRLLKLFMILTLLKVVSVGRARTIL